MSRTSSPNAVPPRQVLSQGPAVVRVFSPGTEAGFQRLAASPPRGGGLRRGPSNSPMGSPQGGSVVTPGGSSPAPVFFAGQRHALNPRSASPPPPLFQLLQQQGGYGGGLSPRATLPPSFSPRGASAGAGARQQPQLHPTLFAAVAAGSSGASTPAPARSGDVVIQGHRFHRVTLGGRSPSPRGEHSPIRVMHGPTHRHTLGGSPVHRAFSPPMRAPPPLGSPVRPAPGQPTLVAVMAPAMATVNIDLHVAHSNPESPSTVLRFGSGGLSPRSPLQLHGSPLHLQAGSRQGSQGTVFSSPRNVDAVASTAAPKPEVQLPLQARSPVTERTPSQPSQPSPRVVPPPTEVVTVVQVAALEPLPASSRFEPLPLVKDSVPTEIHVKLVQGAEVRVGSSHLRCVDVLGSGSYSVVWRATPLSGEAARGKEGAETPAAVALKDVYCRSRASLRQTLFEIELLLACEQQVAPAERLRLPLCLSHSVAAVEDGWCVRSVMNILPGEQLDQWLFREADAASAPARVASPSSGGDGAGASSAGSRPEVSWISHLGQGCVLARTLILQMGPTLEHLAPMAWHRDVNSHNVLVSSDGTTFWLCDLGLAADSRAWPSEGDGATAAWKVTDIGGDCRYWPPSCWMVHCHGTEYLEALPAFCQQYQFRLDIHGIGITAIEVLCQIALAAYESSGACGAERTGANSEQERPWAQLLSAWKLYRDTVGAWWERIYAVFSEGGDIRPVHSWLKQHMVAEQTIELLESLHQALDACARVATPSTARLLGILRELTSELSDLGLREACDRLKADGGPEESGKASPVAPTPPSPTPPHFVAAADGASESQEASAFTSLGASPTRA